MEFLSPLVIAAAILIVLTLGGLIAAFVRERRLFRGYEEIELDSRRLSSKIGGEIFRDGNDLVINGRFRKMPTVLRFSYSETTPGVSMRVYAPATFNIWFIPKSGSFDIPEGGISIATPDDIFNARFITRTDDPATARIFLAGNDVMASIKKLACSSRTMVTISRGIIDLIETIIPQTNTGGHLGAHLEAIAVLTETLRQMPSAALVQVKYPRRERRLGMKAVLATGVAAAIVTIMAAHDDTRKDATAQEVSSSSVKQTGITPEDARLMFSPSSWRAVNPGDVDLEIAGWGRVQGITPMSRIVFNADAEEEPNDVAYLLRDDKGRRRFVLIVDKKIAFDAMYDGEPMIAPVRRDAIGSIQWNAPKPFTAHPDGDGIMLVRSPQNPDAAIVLYLEKGKLEVSQPSSWRSVPVIPQPTQSAT